MQCQAGTAANGRGRRGMAAENYICILLLGWESTCTCAHDVLYIICGKSRPPILPYLARVSTNSVFCSQTDSVAAKRSALCPKPSPAHTYNRTDACWEASLLL